MTVNHHRHITYLEYAQAGYKRVILHHRSRKVLRNCVKIALPSLVLPIKERESRDESIIRLVLYYLRNITAIRHPNPINGDAGEDIGRNATIKAFSRDNVLHLLLTIASGMGEDFNVQDVPVMEILFHLLKGVNMKELFMSDSQVENQEKENLASLLALEKGMETIRNRDGPTRHNRFGTQLWVSRGVSFFSKSIVPTD
jgi:replication fork protection complex subunit Tof1/Swi1